MLKSQPSVHQNMTVFGDRTFKEVIKESHLINTVGQGILGKGTYSGIYE